MNGAGDLLYKVERFSSLTMNRIIYTKLATVPHFAISFLHTKLAHTIPFLSWYPSKSIDFYCSVIFIRMVALKYYILASNWCFLLTDVNYGSGYFHKLAWLVPYMAHININSHNLFYRALNTDITGFSHGSSISKIVFKGNRNAKFPIHISIFSF